MRLYKYFHPDRTDVLRTGKIRFSSPKTLNDPFELKPHLSDIVETDSFYSEVKDEILLKEYAKLPKQYQQKISLKEFQRLTLQHLPELKNQILNFSKTTAAMAQRGIAKQFEELIGVLCLSETPTNLLMWAHYADAHQGFVLEFDAENPFFNQKKSPEDELRHLQKVEYKNERPSFILTEMEGFSPFLTTKSIDWSYEAEWRMIRPLSEASETIGNDSNRVHLFKFPRMAIRSIIFGCRMETTKQAEIHQILQETDELNSIQCMKAQIDERFYRLCLYDIS